MRPDSVNPLWGLVAGVAIILAKDPLILLAVALNDLMRGQHLLAQLL